MSWLRHPALQFAALGAALFVIDRRLPETGAGAATRAIIVDVATLRSAFSARTASYRRPPTRRRSSTTRSSKRCSTARRSPAGLDRGDRSIRHRLVEKAHFVSACPRQTRTRCTGGARARLERDDILVRRMLIEKMRLFIAAPLAAREPDDAELTAYLARHPERYVSLHG